MDQDFTFLIDGNLACGSLGLGLRAVMGGVSAIACAAYSPGIIAGYYVLVLSGHGVVLFKVQG
jgi:hypothetical protein